MPKGLKTFIYELRIISALLPGCLKTPTMTSVWARKSFSSDLNHLVKYHYAVRGLFCSFLFNI